LLITLARRAVPARRLDPAGARWLAWTLSGIVAAAPAPADDPRLPAALALVMLGAFTKSAQFPFHFWLPNAMSAPTPVSPTCIRPPW
jgi:NADH:ubiquinone oxidoreductase subunit 5 (subunit L)/multisubunit Na+/H+ antiporter MnhA subunit